jgi:hypothetical protein
LSYPLVCTRLTPVAKLEVKVMVVVARLSDRALLVSGDGIFERPLG